MAQMTLDERFSQAPPKRERERTHAWLDAEERRFILWGFKERWTAVRIGNTLGVNEATVRRFRKQYTLDPGLILELGLLEMVGKIEDEEYRCLVCSHRITTEREAERHMLSHFLDKVFVDGYAPPKRGKSKKGQPKARKKTA